MTKIENTQKIKNIKIKPSVHCFCPLGNDFYSMDLIIDFTPGNFYPDYCDIEKYLNENIREQNLIVEDVLNNVYNFMSLYEPLDLEVKGIVTEVNSHSPVEVIR